MYSSTLISKRLCRSGSQWQNWMNINGGADRTPGYGSGRGC